MNLVPGIYWPPTVQAVFENYAKWLDNDFAPEVSPIPCLGRGGTDDYQERCVSTRAKLDLCASIARAAIIDVVKKETGGSHPVLVGQITLDLCEAATGGCKWIGIERLRRCYRVAAKVRRVVKAGPESWGGR